MYTMETMSQSRHKGHPQTCTSTGHNGILERIGFATIPPNGGVVPAGSGKGYLKNLMAASVRDRTCSLP
jgi:hypothetical protein